MTLFRAIVLGLVQGLTEFLPVSSSGHLILIPRMLGWEQQPLSFDVALHAGTTLAVLIYFRRDILLLIRHTLIDVATQRFNLKGWSPYGRLALMIILGCVPAVLVGGLFSDAIEEHARGVWLVAFLMVLFALFMLAADRWARHDSDVERLDPKRALVIGVAQAMALLPGVSRSGTTIATGMFSGLSRTSAARFSFLLSSPVIVAAAVLSLPDLRHASTQGVSPAELAAGCLVSFAVGMTAIHWLLRFLATRSLTVFVWYRFAFAALAVGVIALA